MGELTPGTQVSATVQLSNTTPRPLTIKSIRQSCACAVKKMSPELIAPGEHAELRVQYAVPTALGPVRHVLLVEYQEAVPPTPVVIHGTVREWANVAPGYITFSEVTVGEQAEIDVAIHTKEPWPTSERTAKIQLEYASILREETSACGRHVTYRLGFTPPATAEHRRYHGEFMVRCNKSEGRVVRIPSAAVVGGRYAPEPKEVFFGIVPTGTTQRMGVQLRDNGRGRPAFAPSALRVRHNLPPGFYVDPLAAADDILTLAVGVDASDPGVTGLINGRVAILDSEDGVVCSFPVSAFIRQPF